MLSAAIFDVDGTLVAFRFDVQSARLALVRELSTIGFVTAGLDASTPIQGILDEARAQAQGGRVGPTYEEVRGRLYSILDSFEARNSPSASAFPGTLEILNRLIAKDVRLAVVTNSGRKSAELILSNNGLSDCFEFILTRDDVGSMKPSPEGLQLAADKLAGPKDSLCYVGDSVQDVTAAKLAGLKVVSVATGNYTSDNLRGAGADYVIESLRQLPGIFGL
ncbi:MAG: HAD family hydrolase [Thaumarchaeota archaeon]|nr:HAD family hydrolase [Nitrososphaerota archaeon]